MQWSDWYALTSAALVFICAVVIIFYEDAC